MSSEHPSIVGVSAGRVAIGWLALLVTTGLLCGAGVGVANAAGQAPGEPASFFGSAQDADGDPIRSGETIVAVVDGESRAEIVVDPRGEYGGSDAFDEKLRLDSDAGDEVVFRFADGGGPIGGTAPLDAGVFETNLTFPNDAYEYVSPAATASIGVTTITPGETVSFSGTDSTAYADARLASYRWSVVHDGNETAAFDGETATRSFNETGVYEAELTVTDGLNRTDTANATFEVLPESEIESPEPTGGSGGVAGGSGGGAGGGSLGGSSGGAAPGTDTNDETDDAVNEVTPDANNESHLESSPVPLVEETVRIDDATPERPGTAVAFEASTIRRIVFERDTVSGNVTVRKFGVPTDDAPPLPEGVHAVSASVVTVPTDQRDEAATVRAVVDETEVRAEGLNADALGVYRLPDGAERWQSLSTETNETDRGLVVEAETPGFSQFAIAAPNASTSASADPVVTRGEPRSARITVSGKEEGASGDAPSEDADEDDLGIVRPVIALVALLAVIGTVGRLYRTRGRGR